ncbi:MAG: right-handed parallel beta-helix repeat-containing protein [Pirellulales bacterium]
MLERRDLLAAFTLTLDRFLEIDNPDGGFDDGDYYAVVRIHDFPEVETDAITGSDIYPNWVFTVDIPIEVLNVEVYVSIYDEDGGLRFGDDLIDINSSRAGASDLHLTVNRQSGAYTGDVTSSGPSDYVTGNADGGGLDRGRLFFTVDTDGDGDGLMNSWEINGLDVNKDGVIDLDLPGLGANPRHKDLFVELDAMQLLQAKPLPPIQSIVNVTPIRVNSLNHGLSTGTQIAISGAPANTNANGTWTVTRLNNSQFTLDASTGNISCPAAGTCGTWTLPAVTAAGLATNTVMDLVIDSFFKAPVSNPDGNQGINLHVQVDEQALPFQSWDRDADGDGIWPYGEDLNGNGVLEVNELDVAGDGFDTGDDTNGNGRQDPGEIDVAGDGFDTGDDLNGNGVQDLPWEDVNRNGILDSGEDRDGNGCLNSPEDIDNDCILDGPEDLNGNGLLDPGEDINPPNGRLDFGEDRNGNGRLDTFEDADNDGVFDNGDTDDQGGWLQFRAFKQAWFGTAAQRADPNAAQILQAKRTVYRYAVLADFRVDGDTKGVKTGSSGIQWGNSNANFMVTLGNWPTIGGTEEQQSATFMHEFGHALGLGHGGGDGSNYKPNYHSLMNYTWQFSNALFDASWDFDYSIGTFPALNENNLVESAGIGGHVGHQTQFSFVNPATGAVTPVVVAENGAVDWNNDGDTTDTLVCPAPVPPAPPTCIPPDINRLGGPTPSLNETLTDYNDWANLKYQIDSKGLVDPTSGGDEHDDRLDYTTYIEAQTFTLAGNPITGAPLAAADGTLTLFMGPYASLRSVHFGQLNEQFTVEHLAGSPNSPTGETVRVSAFGYVQEFSGVKRIFADGGNGNDMIVLGGTVLSPAELHGGDGDDFLQGGLAADMLWGDAGNDVILAGGGIGDQLFGGDGDDWIVGSDAGSDTDANFLDGLYFGDVIDAGPGNDTVFGMGGADNIQAGDGDDRVDSGIGSDWVRGGAGNDYIYAGHGLGDRLEGDADADTIYGSHEGNDTITGGDGDDQLFGQGGNDQLNGELGNDFLDGGTGTDLLIGGDGDDEILGGGGAGDTLDGGNGNEILRGSDDGGDSISGGVGRDRVYGNGGNDILDGGADDDTIDGGGGDDTISGDGGSDLLIGGADHDVIYGYRASAAGDDNAVDYIYGDFGTNGSEPGSGRDRLFGQGGNDLLFGEGGDDALDGGGGDLVDYGSGEGANPADFIPPTPTPPPTLIVGQGIALSGQSLPQGADARGRWTEFGGSAGDGGLSNSPGFGMESSITVAADGSQYVAWVDNRHGNYEIYVARHSAGSAWQELAGSASGGGVSNTTGSSRRPSIVLGADQQPIVVWTDSTGSASNIRAARFDPAANAGSGGWVALGSSLSAGGISATGTADAAQIVLTAAGPVVAWLDSSSGAPNAFARRFSGGVWSGLGGASQATGVGVSGLAVASGGARDIALATDGTKVSVAWTAGFPGQVQLREFSGSVWNELGGSASSAGVSATAGDSSTPTLVYHQGRLYLAWQETVRDPIVSSVNTAEVFAAYYSGAAWQRIGDNRGISQSNGRATSPQLSAGGNELYLSWSDLWRESRPGQADDQSAEIYVRRWDGTNFDAPAANIPNEGVTSTTGGVANVRLAVDAAGHPNIVWTEQDAQRSATSPSVAPQVYVLGNRFDATRVFVADATHGVQAILDGNDLGSGDLIYVYGSVAGFAIAADDAGVLVAGIPESLQGGAILAPRVTGAVTVSANDVTFEAFNISAVVAVTAAARFTARNVSFDAGLTLSAATDAQVLSSRIAGDGLTLAAGSDRALVTNSLLAGVTGLRFGPGGASDVQVRDNQFSGVTGIDVQADSGGRIANNVIAATATGLSIGAPFAGTVEANEIRGATIGVQYDAPAALSRNRVHHNTTGVASTVAGTLEGLGFVAATQPNDIYANTTGVQLSGQMQNQHVFDNAVGVAGTGVLGGNDFAFANLIERNAVGVNFTGPIQYNRIGHNATGISAINGQLITHNVMYGSSEAALRVTGRSDVRIVQNTMYSATADLIRIDGGSSNVEIRNNILWSEGGYDIFVASDSQTGFFSDYNDLHASGTGKLVQWSGVAFTDILDWQQDVAQFDLHSIGRTAVNPHRTEPRFVNKARDDYRTFALVAGQRFSSPTIDGGDPRADRGLPAAATNLLANGSFEGLLTGWNTNPAATTRTASPAPFDGGRYFTGGSAATGFAEQTINLLTQGFTAAELDSQDLVADFGGRIRSAAETPRDLGQVTLQFYNASSVLLHTATAVAINTTDRWELVGSRVQVPAGTRSMVYRFESVRLSGATSDSFLDGAFVRVVSATSAPDIGAFGNTTADVPLDGAPAAHIALRSPDLYVDWERDKLQAIRWESFGNTAESPVRISLYQDSSQGPALLTTIAAVAPDTGEFFWSPVNSGIGYGTHGLRIQVQLVGDTVALDRGAESFSVPENTTDFYINDRDGSATAGNNRHTGKIASAPKPLPNNVLRIYSLAANDTFHVDQGDYALFSSLLITNLAGQGDDEGFVMTGPTAPGATALFHLANPLFALAPVIELSDADFMTMTRLATDGGTYGLLIRNGSENFVGDRLTAAHASLDGLRIESTAAGSTLDRITSTANGRYGISVDGPIEHIFDGDIGFNQDAGIRVSYGAAATNTVRIEGNTVHDNRGSGIFTNYSGPTVVGNEDLSAGRGNIVRDNAGYGIEVYNATALVLGNTVSGQRTAGRAGIYTAGTAAKNVVFDNYAGIDGGGSLIANNRVYGNKTVGIRVGGGRVAIGNVVYANGAELNPELGVGIEAVSNGASISNNVVYGNTGQGIRLRGSASVVNNTVYQTAGDAVHVEGQVSGVQLRNNILWASGGFAISVPSNSQIGFQSDYNLLYATGGGQIGSWQGAARATLNAWRNAAFTDQNSLSQNPLFVDFVDFHEQSLYGSYHGAALAPVLGVVSGLPEMPAGAVTTDGMQSPAIDRGLAIDAYGNEVSPNGGFINVGAYGNTSFASLSPAQYVLVTLPDGGEVWPAGQSFPIRWRSHDATGDVRLELIDANNAVQLVIADPTANDGEFVWAIPAGFTPGNYRVRVTRLDAGNQSDTSNNPFAIPAPVNIYYVNDATAEAGDWTTAPGNDANDGFSPATPKASIRAMLEAYDFGPGDTIRVDAGIYNLTANILIASDDSGVTIEGFHTATLANNADLFADNRSLRTVLNRGNTAGGSYIFQFTGADDVTLSHLAMTGSEYAVVALSGADSDGVTVEYCEIYNNYRGGVTMDATNENQRIRGNRIFGSLDGYGIGVYLASASGAIVSNNSAFNMYYGSGIEVWSLFNASLPNAITDNSVYFVTTGIVANGNTGNAGITVSGNDVHDSRFTGIQANVYALVTDNTVHDNPTGISAQTVRNNVVYNNQTGIDIGGSGIAEKNRAYNNSVVGIAASGGVVQSNVLYSNNVGARVAGTAQFVNNLVYDNANDGIWVWYGSGGRIENNTIYQNGGGDAIQIGGPHPEFFVSTFAPNQTTIVNNILHVEQGYAMNFAADSGVGSTLDYNNLHITGSGKLARWQNRDFTGLSDWYYELGFDQHSQTSDPQFVSPVGVDGTIGYRATEVGLPQIIDNGAAGFTVSGPWQHVAQANGASGDFLENAQSATARWVFTGSSAYPAAGNLFIDVPVSASWVAHPGLGSATYTHTTSASYTVTYNTGSGPFNVPMTANFSGAIATIDQSTAGSGVHAIGSLHLGFPNVYAQAGFVSVSSVTLATTLRVGSAANVIADAATIYGTTVDDGDANFSKEGFNWVPAGRDGDYHVRPANTDLGAATWEFTGLTPGASYSVAALWTSLPGNARAAEFSIFDGDLAVRWAVRDLLAVPNDFTDAQGVSWNRLGTVKVTGDRLRVKLAGPGKLQADAIRIQEVVGDRAADDDFHVTPSSPTIDAGSLVYPFANEPAPNGARINLGHTGNTAEATTSPAQFVQVLAPNGLEKFEGNQPIAIEWRQAGLPFTYAPDSVLADGPAVYYRLNETTGTTANDSSSSGLHGTYTGGVTLGVTGATPGDPVNLGAQFDGLNDFVGVPVSPALNTAAMTIEAWINPDATITTYSTLAMKSTSNSWNDGYGMYWNAGKLRFFINQYNGGFVEASVATGAWSHVAGTYDGATIKLYVNGNLAASAAYSTPINSSAQPLQIGRGQGGYFWKGRIDEFSVYGTALAAGQIATHYSRQDFGTAKIELVQERTNDAIVIADATPNDGALLWTMPASIVPGRYTIRVTADAGITPSDSSDAAFLIASAGQHYYVNDASTAGDVFTTAIGDNGNSGKTPAAPMASLGALLAAYNLDLGDVIHVDAGVYNLVKNVVIDATDSGVRIEGPGAVGSTSIAMLNRGSTTVGSFVIQISGADDVTLDSLDITGGEYGIVAVDSTDSDRLTVTSSEIHGNSKIGIYIGPLNDDSRIEGNRLFVNQQGGIFASSNVGTIVHDNVLYTNNVPGFGGTGITINSSGPSGNKSVVRDNEVYGNDLGISASGNALIEVMGNLVHHNYSGIRAANNVVVSQNEAYFNQGYHWSIGYGISASSATIVDNVTHDNDRGIDAGASTIRNNRIYHNRDTGIQAGGANLIVGNTIYGHALGVRMQNNDAILNNLLYDNANDSIWVWSGSGGRIENNTIYQSTTGDAIQVGGPHPDQFVTTFSAANLSIKNNILRVAQGYAINVAADSEIGFASDYNDFVLAGTGKLGRWEDRDFTSQADWFYELGFDRHSIVADPQFVDIDGADNVLGYDSAVNLDRGLDDNFRVLTTSRTIDAGDPRGADAAEPIPNGSRVNLGHTGNTPLAATSPGQFVQVLAPNGLEKYETGQSIPIQWHSAGLTPSRAVALIDASGNGSGSWSANSYQIAGQTFSFTTPVNLAGVANPAPASTYQVGTYGGFGAGNRVAYAIPASDGSYTVRLHFVEPGLTGPGQRLFDIKLNGVTVRTGFDIFAAAGGQYKATTLSFDIAANNGGGISLEMVNPTNTYGAFVTGIEITAANPLGVPNPTVDIALSTDSGATWTTIAAGVGMDQYGRGEYFWTAGPQTVGNTALIGIRSNNVTLAQDISDTAFLIANNGSQYYLNDGSTAGDVFTSAVGNNFNSGKSPDAPMASLRALLAAYDLDAGDIVHVDTGTYRLYRNLVFDAQASGVRIEGPGATPAGQAAQATALFNRGNTTTSSFVFELTGADDVTLDHLAITGGTIGVYAAAGVQSDRLTVSASEVFANTASSSYGIYIGAGNPDARILGNRVHDNTGTTSAGIYAEAARARIENNEVFGELVGISTTYFGTVADRILVSGNRAHGNISIGIFGQNQVLVTGNTAYEHLAAGAIGIQVRSTSQPIVATENVVYNNNIGLLGASSNVVVQTVQNNRAFGNAVGIRVYGVSQVLGNKVYSNAIGISGDPSSGFNGRIANNLVYANANQGIYIERSFGAGGEIVDNTVYQPVGEAIRLANVSQGMAVRNNILAIDSGYAIYVAANSQSNIASDYNLIHLSADPNAHAGFWGSAPRHTLADWRTASGLDAASLAADPLFVDRDGSDNALGYTTVDRGRDDNFYLRAGSPAIDRGDRWNAQEFDIDDLPRRDDPGKVNAGRGDYAPTVLASSLFAATGVAQNWRSNDSFATYTLPFAFPFYDGSATTVYVSTEGFLQFGTTSGAGDGANDTAKFKNVRRIAALWDNVRTNAVGDDIFVDASTAGQVTFRWNATNEIDSSDVQFATTLFSDGRIRFDYRPGANLSPTVGVSMGNGRAYVLAVGYDGAATLAGAPSVLWQLAPSFADIGAYEFRGSSFDSMAPAIAGSTPTGVFASTPVAAPVGAIRLQFSEEVNPIDARAPANYELRSPGPGGVYGDANDVVYTIQPQFAIGSNFVELAIENGPLADGEYRLTVFSNVGSSIHDLAGLRLDGDADGTAGGNFVRIISVESVPALVGDLDGDNVVGLKDLAILQSYFGIPSGATRVMGDLNGDGAVTRQDVALLAQNYGRSIGSPAPAAAPATAAAIVAHRVSTTKEASQPQLVATRHATPGATRDALRRHDGGLRATRRRALAVDHVLSSEMPLAPIASRRS